MSLGGERWIRNRGRCKHRRGIVGLPDAKDAGDEVEVTVHNEGPPIPENFLPHIFEPLVRDTRDDSERVPGSFGLGLFVVKQLVASHGGEVSVTSTRGGGTTFTVRLPRLPREGRQDLSFEVTESAAREAGEARARSSAAHPIRRGRRIAAPR